MTPADRIYAQHADLYGTCHDEQPGLGRDWTAARASHQNTWQRIRRPFNRRVEARKAAA